MAHTVIEMTRALAWPNRPRSDCWDNAEGSQASPSISNMTGAWQYRQVEIRIRQPLTPLLKIHTNLAVPAR